MIIDVHSHLAPKGLVQDASSGYTLDVSDDGQNYTLRTGRYNVPVGEDMFSPEIQIKQMEHQGIDKKVICIPPFLFGTEKDRSAAKSWVRNCNEWISEVCEKYPDKFIGFGTLPLESIEDAVEELHYCMETLGLKGVEVGTNYRGTDLDNTRFTLLYDELNILSCPVLIHPTSVRSHSYLNVGHLENLLGNPFETAVAASRMLLAKIFEKYPSINFCLSHGGGVLPYLLGRIGHKHKSMCNKDGDISLPKTLFFDTVIFNKESLKFLVKRCGNVVLGSDYPFDMAEFDPIGFVTSALGRKEAADVLQANPRQFLGL